MTFFNTITKTAAQNRGAVLTNLTKYETKNSWGKTNRPQDFCAISTTIIKIRKESYIILK